ncbi:MAG: hypothetical protein SVU32_07510 [Candidatus Nanohaloarchaea archaeon]|nr:hypothetical protein [Candidatus Nanohaloarchaea archaeon]
MMTVTDRLLDRYRSWRDGVDYAVIDPEIRDLCAGINQHQDLETLSSCQGHYREEDVRESTRSGPAGPYVIVEHDEPGDDLEEMFGQLEDCIEELDEGAEGHRGFLVRQLYPAGSYPPERKRVDRLLHPVLETEPSEPPAGIRERYGGAVELVRDETQIVDSGDVGQYMDADSLQHRSTVIDFQELEDGMPDDLEEERDWILDRLTTFFREL